MPNLLSADDATFDTGLGGWVAQGSALADRVTSPTPHAGSGALHLYNSNFLLANLDLSDYFDELEIGALTKCSVWVRQSASNPNPDNRLGAVSAGGMFSSYAEIPTDQWVEMGSVGPNTGPIGTTDMSIGAYESDVMGEWGDFYFSDVWFGKFADTSPPTDLTPTGVGTTGVNLGWTFAEPQFSYAITWHDGAPDQESTNEIPFAYEVEVSEDGISYTLDEQVSGISHSVTVSGLTPSTTYWFRVRTGVTEWDDNTSIIGGYSEYTAPVMVTTDALGGGGWGVGMVRMGAN